METVNTIHDSETLYVAEGLYLSDYRLKQILEEFWNSKSLKKIFLLRKSVSGGILSKIKVLDKEECPQPTFSFEN